MMWKPGQLVVVKVVRAHHTGWTFQGITVVRERFRVKKKPKWCKQIGSISPEIMTTEQYVFNYEKLPSDCYLRPLSLEYKHQARK